MKVVSYLASVPAKNTNKQKTDLLEYFIEGVNKSGDNGILHKGFDQLSCDIGVIQGWVYENKSPPHLKLRNNVINTQLQQNKFICTADANLFLYADLKNTKGYLRYSFNGVFPNTGIYCDNNIDINRWIKISKDYNITPLPIKNNGNHILIMLQRQDGWSMQGQEVVQWTLDQIKEIHRHTDRSIIIRPHPGDKKAKDYLYHNRCPLNNLKNVKISRQGTPLAHDLTNAWAVVNHNSSAIVGPIIQGHHAFITDPISSQCAEVSNTNYNLIESPKEFDRERWLQRISMFHWNFDELRSGECWQHMRNYVQ